jgi:hypothetical protein
VTTVAVQQRDAEPLTSDVRTPSSTEEFPLGALPEPFRRYADERAQEIGVPPEMVAVPLMVAAGAAIGRGRALCLKPGFVQYPVLFAAVVAPPGCAKSPALNAALYPTLELQKSAFDRHRLASSDSRSASSDGHAAASALEHFYTINATMEAIAPMLTSSPGLLVHHDELLALVRSCDAYRNGRGADRQGWMSLWSCQPIKIDRRGTPPIWVEQPVVSVVGSAQPDMLHHFHDPHHGRDGFVERIVWTAPEVGPAQWTMATTDQQLLDEVVRAFAALRRAPECGTVTATNDALGIWIEWHDRNAASTARLDGLAAGFASKLPNQVARLALILHAMADIDGERPTLQDKTMQSAIDVAEYFRRQFRKVLPLIVRNPRAEALPLAGLIRQLLSDGRRWSRTQVMVALGGRVKADQLTQALEELEISGVVIREQGPSTGGRRPEFWRLNPQSALSA